MTNMFNNNNNNNDNNNKEQVPSWRGYAIKQY
jgi:hypothetical protein